MDIKPDMHTNRNAKLTSGRLCINVLLRGDVCCV